MEVLLVTSRRSGRWLIPKGWPMEGLSLAEAAAREAYEEAGVHGIIDQAPFGWFTHDKQHDLFGPMTVRIAVHLLAVDRELSSWPELGERKRRWFSPRQAIEQVQSEELAALIRQLRSNARLRR